MIYLTFVGNHDKLDNQQNGPGAVLTIFLQYKARTPAEVFLFGQYGEKLPGWFNRVTSISESLNPRFTDFVPLP